MKKKIIGIISILLLINFTNIASAKLIENKDYVVLPESSDHAILNNEKIEVVEFFSYGCSYCYSLEPKLVSWVDQKANNVVFKRIAIPRKGRWVEYARLFYALGMISVTEQERITRLIYPAIHEEKLFLDDATQLIDWSVKQGVDRDALMQHYFSDAVTAKLTDALLLAQSYDLKYVPSVYVNNQYRVVLTSSNQYQDTKDKLNQLIEMVQKQ